MRGRGGTHGGDAMAGPGSDGDATTTRRLGRALGRVARRFARAEDGVLMIFGLFVLLVMMMAAGLAVDTIRHERERARTQATLDRAVLAAADLRQTLTPQEVVADYFVKAGLSDRLGEVDALTSLNHKQVTASTAFDVPTMLLHMVGVDTLGVATTARAEERVTDVEISLVLDVSGSMGWHNRLTNLRRAATEFVTTVMPEVDRGQDRGVTTVSLVPYATSVNVGGDLMALYNVNRVHTHSNCVLFQDADYNDAALPPSRPLTQYEHFDPGNGGYSGYNPYQIAKPLCPRAAASGQRERNALIPLSTDRAALTSAIANLEADNSTETDAGMRWGIAMLDPQTRPVVDALVAQGRVGPSASGRPLAYRAEDSLKVAVLMTDGEPQAPFDLNPKLKGGDSNVWYDKETNQYSVLLRRQLPRAVPLRPCRRDGEGRMRERMVRRRAHRAGARRREARRFRQPERRGLRAAVVLDEQRGDPRSPQMVPLRSRRRGPGPSPLDVHHRSQATVQSGGLRSRGRASHPVLLLPDAEEQWLAHQRRVGDPEGDRRRVLAPRRYPGGHGLATAARLHGGQGQRRGDLHHRL